MNKGREDIRCVIRQDYPTLRCASSAPLGVAELTHPHKPAANTTLPYPSQAQTWHHRYPR